MRQELGSVWPGKDVVRPEALNERCPRHNSTVPALDAFTVDIEGFASVREVLQ